MTDTLKRQRALLETWLRSDDAQRLANNLVRSRRMRRAPEELISEAWLKVHRHMASRTEPLPDMDDDVSAARYMYRVLDNLSRDMLRFDGRRQDIQHIDNVVVPVVDASPESRVVIEELILCVGRLVQTPRPCDGCSPAVVASAALALLHLILNESDGGINGRTILDRLLYEALQQSSHDRALSDDALRQRKARCGPCITELLADGMEHVGLSAP